MTLQMRWRVVSISLVTMQRLLLSCMVGCLLWLLATPALGLPREVLYDQIISATARHYALDPALVKAVIKCESRFDPWAQSPRGAQGLMQLMPATQTLLGVTDVFDPQHNVTAGVRYLAMLRQTFGDNVTLLLAAYNAGPQAVIAAGYTVPPYAETQQYVRCVLDAQRHYHQNGLPQASASMLTARGRTCRSSPAGGEPVAVFESRSAARTAAHLAPGSPQCQCPTGAWCGDAELPRTSGIVYGPAHGRRGHHGAATSRADRAANPDIDSQHGLSSAVEPLAYLATWRTSHCHCGPGTTSAAGHYGACERRAAYVADHTAATLELGGAYSVRSGKALVLRVRVLRTATA